MKNNNLKFFFLFALVCLGVSCNLLDQTSPNDIDAENAIKNAAGAEAALIGVYSSMQNSYYYGSAYVLVAEASSDNSVTGGYSFISLDQIGNRAVTSENIIVEQMWYNMYRVIANTNHLIAALPNITDLESARKKEIEGQARAIRAMTHFDLLRYFGEHWDSSSKLGVPIISTIQDANALSSRATVAENYTFIEAELEAALSLVNATDTRVQYINANSINALLARLELYHGNKAKAEQYATKVIDNPTYALLNSASYNTVFTGRRTVESIFELAFDSQNRSLFNSNTYVRKEALRPEISYMASENLGKFFAERKDDIRSTLVNFDPTQNDGSIVPDGRSEKYRGEEIQDNPAYICRLAEQYLIRAEAKGNVAGLADLNLLRTTRGMAALTASDVDTEEKFVNVLLEERRAELNFEGHRLFDLARTKNIKKILNIDGFRSILPIPVREISASNGKYEQNPGY